MPLETASLPTVPSQHHLSPRTSLRRDPLGQACWDRRYSPDEEGRQVAADLNDGVLRPGAWAVMSSGGVLHLAETVSGLPRGRALCGAVGTAFVVSAPARPATRVCERCTELGRPNPAVRR